MRSGAGGARRDAEAAERQRILEPAPEELPSRPLEERKELRILVEERLHRAPAVARLEPRHKVWRAIEPCLDLLQRRLQVALDRIRDAPIADRLVLIPRRAGEANGAGRQVEVADVAFEDLHVRREAAKDRVAPRRRSEEHLVGAELRLRTQVDARVEGGGEKLRPEADAEVRHARQHRFTDRSLLVDEPWKLVLLPDAHGSAHDDE